MIESYDFSKGKGMKREDQKVQRGRPGQTEAEQGEAGQEQPPELVLRHLHGGQGDPEAGLKG